MFPTSSFGTKNLKFVETMGAYLIGLESCRSDVLLWEKVNRGVLDRDRVEGKEGGNGVSVDRENELSLELEGV
jgi:hypothetical protein